MITSLPFPPCTLMEVRPVNADARTPLRSIVLLPEPVISTIEVTSVTATLGNDGAVVAGEKGVPIWTSTRPGVIGSSRTSTVSSASVRICSSPDPNRTDAASRVRSSSFSSDCPVSPCENCETARSSRLSLRLCFDAARLNLARKSFNHGRTVTIGSFLISFRLRNQGVRRFGVIPAGFLASRSRLTECSGCIGSSAVVNSTGLT